ncbi:MAG: hypothetical protein WBX02_12330 [Terriglobales bacterium]
MRRPAVRPTAEHVQHRLVVARVKASKEDATQAVMALAAGTLDEAGYTAWLLENARRKLRYGRK